MLGLLIARSIVSKVDELEALIFCYDRHVIIISETWLRDNIPNIEVVPSDKRLIRKERSFRGGVVAISVKENLGCQSMEAVDSTESGWCKLNVFGVLFLTFRTSHRQPGKSL